MQSIPHWSGLPSHVAVPLVVVGQGMHAAVVAVVPQDITLLFCAHIIPQRW